MGGPGGLDATPCTRPARCGLPFHCLMQGCRFEILKAIDGKCYGFVPQGKATHASLGFCLRGRQSGLADAASRSSQRQRQTCLWRRHLPYRIDQRGNDFVFTVGGGSTAGLLGD